MMPEEETSLCFVTWNTCGVKNTSTLPNKFSDILNILRNLQAHIVFIQETHVGPDCYKILEDENGTDWKVYFTVHSSRSKGVAILIKDNIPFKYICHDEDCSGRYIVLFCHLYGELYTLVNVYNHKADRNVLTRLKEYLRETAKGVVVVGGDFNTVLHPSFDRRPPRAWHSPLRAILEDFTGSLNLRDTWSYSFCKGLTRFTDEGFTRFQKKTYSRLDMFFLPEEKMGQVCKMEVIEQINGSILQNISDHYPLVLKLKVQEQTEQRIPNSAIDLNNFTNNPDRRPGKISGAEILSVIKSLTDSVKCRPNGSDMRSQTETLKTEYNLWIKNKKVHGLFKNGYSLEDKRLIFHTILAKRMSVFITPSFKGKTATKLDIALTVTFKTGSQKIKWSYLQTRLEYLKMKLIPSAPRAEFSILDPLLHKIQNLSGDFRHLQPGFPLSTTILNLALQHLERLVSLYKWNCEHITHKLNVRKCKEIRSMGSVCYQRQVLLIHTQKTAYKNVLRRVKHFTRISGLEIIIKKHKQT